MLFGELRPIFEAEGFFVNLIDKMRNLYQLRKDEMVISMQREGTDITFTCTKAEISLVNTAMYEATIELERMIAELQKPIDEEAIVRRLQDETSKSGRRIDITAHVGPGTLEPDLKARTKEEVIEELLAILDREGLIRDLDRAREAVWERERNLSTGMQHGIAIPHGRTDAVKELVCAIGLKRGGIDFGSLDGEPSRIFVLVLCPESSAAPYIQFISTISQILDEEGRRNLLACTRPRQMMAALKGARIVREPAPAPPAAEPEEIRVTPETGIGEFLRPELIKIPLDATTKDEVLRELTALLESRGLVNDLERAVTALCERERTMSTAMDRGVAIPHARTDAVDRLVCAVGVKKEGIDFESLDGKPSRIFILLLSPSTKPAPQLQVMAMIARSLEAAGPERLAEAQTPEEFRRLLVESAGERSVFLFFLVQNILKTLLARLFEDPFGPFEIPGRDQNVAACAFGRGAEHVERDSGKREIGAVHESPDPFGLKEGLDIGGDPGIRGPVTDTQILGFRHPAPRLNRRRKIRGNEPQLPFLSLQSGFRKSRFKYDRIPTGGLFFRRARLRNGGPTRRRVTFFLPCGRDFSGRARRTNR